MEWNEYECIIISASFISTILTLPVYITEDFAQYPINPCTMLHYIYFHPYMFLLSTRWSFKTDMNLCTLILTSYTEQEKIHPPPPPTHTHTHTHVHIHARKHTPIQTQTHAHAHGPVV